LDGQGPPGTGQPHRLPLGRQRADRPASRPPRTGNRGAAPVLDHAPGERPCFPGSDRMGPLPHVRHSLRDGFRASGLASLTPESFDLEAEPPTVTLAARSNKNRKLKVQPTPPDLVELLRG